MRALLCAGAATRWGIPPKTLPLRHQLRLGRLNAYNSLVLALTAIEPVKVTSTRKSSGLEHSSNAGSKRPYRIESAISVGGPWVACHPREHYLYRWQRRLDDSISKRQPTPARPFFFPCRCFVAVTANTHIVG